MSVLLLPFASIIYVTCKLKNQPHKSKECYRTHCFLPTSDKKEERSSLFQKHFIDLQK